ncbi:hypothetical protein BBH99_19745 [Chryseobacterium contaminans]|uniref:DUF600 domain-containing protein n=1 Tax=Chryseobacterium contaminans TaxID=1423959 RepID=A0A1M6Y0S8_9FLAO|nr:hypothetical protein [Chryseobacterium contaminans]OCA79195.1 hypothetical protein BBH99_19745 [Chryseobacterium contaminans]SHL11719.1 hypothetical protein SAMN05444407_102299 [Chryseobacterium contaminans]
MNHFDNEFQKYLAELVETGFEFVNNNSEEVDAVYVIGLIETGYFYKVFYEINGYLVKSHKVNEVSDMQYAISPEIAFAMLNKGNQILGSIEELFKNDGREVPVMFKLVYHPKTDKFNSDFSYDKTFTHDKIKTAQDVYEEWFSQVEKLKS